MILIVSFVAIFLLLWIVFIPVGPVVQHALAFFGHRTAAFRYRDYVPVVVLLVAGIIATIAIGDEFLDLAERIRSDSATVQRVDHGVHAWARGQRSAVATLFFTFFTLLGTPVGLAAVVSIVSIVLMTRRRFRWAAYLMITTAIGALLVVQLKLYFARARPDLAEALRSAQGYSFPSGHAMGSTVVFGALSYLILRATLPWRQRAAGLACAWTIIAAISLSRVYLGVHWITDIAAGIAAGTVWVTVATISYEAFRRIRLVRALRAQRSSA